MVPRYVKGRIEALHLLSAALWTLLLFSCPAQAQDWKAGSGHRSAAVQPRPDGKVGFTEMEPVESRVRFTNVLRQATFLTNQILLNGAGVAVGDIDGDGWCDLYLCGLESANALYRNLGNWKFEEIAEKAGVACATFLCTGAALADLDGDGDLDLIVNTVGQGTHVFRGNGRGSFTAAGSPLNLGKGAMSLALADIDGDGDLDLYVANYRTTTLRDMPNTRFRGKNRNGVMVLETVNGRPVTEPDLVGRFSIGVNGGVEEHGEADALFLNDGTGQFAPVAFTSGDFLNEEGQPFESLPYDWGLSAAFRDLNRDGTPDLYVCNDFASPDRIWINDGRGRFRALPREAIRHTSLFSMGVDFADVDRDGHDDIFVAEMLARTPRKQLTQAGDLKPRSPGPDDRADCLQTPHQNTLHRNRGDGTYAEIAWLANLAASDWSWTAMFLDVDLDGFEDLLVTTGHELEMTDADVLERIDQLRDPRRMSSEEQLRLRTHFPRLATPNAAFRNRGDLTFEPAGDAWGFNQSGVSHGMAAADFDRDGDLDLAINHLNQPASLLRNDTPAPRIAVRLKGKAGNTAGIGARIKVTGGPVAQSQEMMSASHYLSCAEALRVFAAGSLANRLTIEVAWRNGRRSVIADAQPNYLYEIEEPAAGETGESGEREGGRPVTEPEGSVSDSGRKSTDSQLPILQSQLSFRDASHVFNHLHHEEPFDDFARQPLLPWRLSQDGPGVSCADLDGDGTDDLIIPSGRGGQLAVFRGDGLGGFVPWKNSAWDAAVARDGTTPLVVRDGAERRSLLLGESAWEDAPKDAPAVRWLESVGDASWTKLPSFGLSAGPLALADIDGDGDLDLFVGGRCVPGRYPEPSPSVVFLREGAAWKEDRALRHVLRSAGLVSGATWTDLDGNGFPDLVLACEWGPPRIYLNERGTLRLWDAPVTSTEGRSPSPAPPRRSNDLAGQLPAVLEPREGSTPLSQWTGWWRGITAGDFDNDGRMDLVASNWGWNSRYQVQAGQTARIYYGEFGGGDGTDVLEAGFDAEVKHYAPLRLFKTVRSALPFIAESVATHDAYSRTSVEALLRGRTAFIHRLEASVLSSMVFLNRLGDPHQPHFEARALPIEAQMTPAFAVGVADFDADRCEDIFLSQNFFATNPELPRQDAGRGLLLRGDGAGGFVPVSGQESGIRVYGEQRGAAVADFNQDGRPDLVVSQNSAATRVFLNTNPRAGLRVRLQGPHGNPDGIGAVLRMKSGDGLGPAREVRSGSGYWSQDSAVQILAADKIPASLMVRWPGGQQTTHPIVPGAREVLVRAGGGTVNVRR